MKYTNNDGTIMYIDRKDVKLIDGYNTYLSINGSKTYVTAQKSEGGKWISKYVHHLIMGNPSKSGMEIHHRNNDGMDNRRNNLAIVSHSHNMLDKPKMNGRKYASKYKGVSLNGKRGYYQAQVNFDGVAYRLGQHQNERRAARYYDIAAKLLCPEITFTNFKTNKYRVKEIDNVLEKVNRRRLSLGLSEFKSIW